MASNVLLKVGLRCELTTAVSEHAPECVARMNACMSLQSTQHFHAKCQFSVLLLHEAQEFKPQTVLDKYCYTPVNA